MPTERALQATPTHRRRASTPLATHQRTLRSSKAAEGGGLSPASPFFRFRPDGLDPVPHQFSRPADFSVAAEAPAAPGAASPPRPATGRVGAPDQVVHDVRFSCAAIDTGTGMATEELMH